MGLESCAFVILFQSFKHLKVSHSNCYLPVVLQILCGPVNVSECLDLTGTGGLVTLTSPQLLQARPRAFLLHIKGFPPTHQPDSAGQSKAKVSGDVCR